MNKFVYADNAATTAVSNDILKSMMPYFIEEYGNPSSLYSIGSNAADAVSQAREKVAKALGATANEIYFTGCGTESNNWAIKSTAKKLFKQGKNHIITSKFEHHAVLHVCETLAKEGFEITYLDVYEDGIVRLEDLENAITDKTALVSIMTANNEIGTVQPIAEIGAICRKNKVLFHTDAVQAVGKMDIDVVRDNIDMLSLSGHKLHAPKGIGALYVKKGVVLPALLEGGAQERRKRAGTENVPYIVALGTAVETAVANMEQTNKKLKAMQDRLIEKALKIDKSRLNGHREKRLAGTVNFCFEGIEGESLLLMLDMKGICASSGSACTSGSLDPSHVLLSIGLPHEVAHGSLRLSFSDNNTEEDVDYIINELIPIVERLRSISPLWDSIMKKENNNGI
ncbi:MAG: cysteine desulfurase NifS [Clostridia bacterium]